MKRFHLFLFGILATIPPAQGAFAASITNLDTVPYDLHVKVGERVEQIHIEPGTTWSTEQYEARVRYQDHWMPLNFDSNYTIWKGGSLVEQSQGAKTRGGKGM